MALSIGDRPECDEDIQLYARQRFETVEQGIEFYRAYSKVVGFDIETGRRGENSKALHCFFFFHSFPGRSSQQSRDRGQRRRSSGLAARRRRGVAVEVRHRGRGPNSTARHKAATGELEEIHRHREKNQKKREEEEGK
nr:protein FAR1-RELATED SEQUENCE 5-like [Ipomoea trifida]